MQFLFLILVFLFLVAFGSINSVFFSSRPKILGFATNIYTKEVIDLTNKERVKAGLEVVKESVTLDKVAQAKAEGFTFLTHDQTLGAYGDSVKVV